MLTNTYPCIISKFSNNLDVNAYDIILKSSFKSVFQKCLMKIEIAKSLKSVFMSANKKMTTSQLISQRIESTMALILLFKESLMIGLTVYVMICMLVFVCLIFQSALTL